MSAPVPATPSRSLVVGSVGREEWNAFVDASPAATLYHRHEWGGVFTRAFGHESRFLAATDDGRVVGILPLVLFRSRLFGRFAVSLPFVNYGGVVAGSPQAAAELLEAAVAAATGCGARHVELRHVERQFPGLPCRQHKVAMRLALAGTAEAQFQALDRKVRNLVRKAEKNNLESRSGGPELVGAFYEVFARNMRDLGTPVYARRFFDEVLRAFPDKSNVLSVWHEGRPVAASIVLWERGMMQVPWASALRDANRLAPNMLLYWEMLRLAIDLGCHTFDFGRSTPDEGTYAFKRQWGAEPVPLHWEYWLAESGPLPDLTPSNPRYALAIKAWQRLPLSVTRWLGPPIVRHIP